MVLGTVLALDMKGVGCLNSAPQDFLNSAARAGSYRSESTATAYVLRLMMLLTLYTNH